jgi:hypothetical protein
MPNENSSPDQVAAMVCRSIVLFVAGFALAALILIR